MTKTLYFKNVHENVKWLKTMSMYLLYRRNEKRNKEGKPKDVLTPGAPES